MFSPTSPCEAGRAAPVRGQTWRAAAAALVLAAPLATLGAATDLSSVPLPTYSTGSSLDIKPNIMMVLDDSGSMAWDYLPDWANDVPSNYSFLPRYLTRNAGFNGVAYNPAVRYQPPVGFTAAGTKDTTTYPSQTGQDAATGANTDPKPNWKRVKNDAYGVQSTSTSDLTNPSFWTMVAGEYCNSSALVNCSAATAPSGTYQYAAPLRWCSNTGLTTCRALQDSTYRYPRAPAPRIGTVTFTGSSSGKTVAGITVDGRQIMSSGTGTFSDSAALAVAVRDRINACASGLTGSCGTVGYSAVASSNVVHVFAPGATAASPSVSSANVTVATTAFQRRNIPLLDVASSTSLSSAPVPGENLRTVITSSVATYPYPGTDRKHANRTDCVSDTNGDGAVNAADSCTFAEEMTNYANWHTYYRTRMQMMKTATSRAFSTLDTDANIAAGDTRYRVGFLSLNNNTGSDFLNVSEFDSSQKFTWYSKLFAAIPNSGTPLRRALAQAGRLYGGKMTGTVFRGSVVTDPLQYSCQKNYTILSTDGFWNGEAGYKLNGTTAVGNVDGGLPRPYNDGGTPQLQSRTSRLQTRTTTQFAERGTLQQQVSELQTVTHQLQSRAEQLQTRTSSDGGNTWTAWTPTSSCSADNNGPSRRQCRVEPVSAWTNASSCTVDASGQDRTGCRYLDSLWSPATSCTPVAMDTSSPYTVGLARSCQTIIIQPYANAASCAVTAPDGAGRFTQCRYVFAASAATATCSPALVANDYTNQNVYRNCTTASGSWTNANSCTMTSTPDASGDTTECRYGTPTTWANDAACSPVAPSTGPSYTVPESKECRTIGTGGNFDTLSDVAAYYYYTDLRSPTATGEDATGTCTGPVIPPATLPNDLCADNVPAFGRDNNAKQHMTTHTLGLGVQGHMVYSHYQNDLTGMRGYYPDYWTQPSGDFHSVANGSTASPATGICPWMANGSTCTWPTPAPDAIANIDDLWHAAVNGHGTYFSAADPQSLAEALTGVLSAIVNTPRPGTAAAAASSNPNITSSDNFVFSSSYRSVDWFGELIMQRFNADGTLSPQQWSAMQLMDCSTTAWQAARAYKVGDAFQNGGTCYVVKVDHTAGASFDATKVDSLPAAPFTRRIYTAGASGLVSFEWSSLDATQRSYFEAGNINYVSASQGLTQFCSVGAGCLSADAQAAAAGQALVNYLRGERTNEGTYFRTRLHVLGDIVSSEARYVKQPLLNYGDAGYALFKAAKASRAPTVYVGANDGMLHAFNALTGQERWAYVPSAVLPDMYRLADTDYANKHRYFVDGTPEVGDICPTAPATPCTDGTGWKTIIVGGLNQGGKAFYALDITDPDTPRLLWEFDNPRIGSDQLGFTYGNPRITKLRDGTWVVIVASGYNNTADGIGRVFVLNASTGALLHTLSTGAGSSATPSGLAKLAARAPGSATNNTVEQVYGGDLLGNVWRFDVNDTIPPGGRDAHLLINLKGSDNLSQPITSKPTVASTDVNTPLVLIGTGRYLGLTDLDDTKSYSFYAIQDKLNASTLGSPRDPATKFVVQTLTATTCPAGTSATICTPGQNVRTVTSEAIDYGVNNGWLIDFPAGGERSVTDATLALGTITFTTIKPQANTGGTAIGCTNEDAGITAKSFLYYLDYLTGGAVQGTNSVGGEELCTCVATRPSVVRTQSGRLEGIIRMSGGGVPTGTDMGVTRREELPYAGGGSTARRISWRELNE